MRVALKNYNGSIPRITVVVAQDGNWKTRIYGEVIGNHEGVVGVLTNYGEYLDVPERFVHIRKVGEGL